MGEEETTVAVTSDELEAEWRNLVDKVLKGAPFERLVTTTLDGIEIQPLYRPSGAETPPPGVAPFVRGSTAAAGRGAEPLPSEIEGSAPTDLGSWDVRVLIDQPKVVEANRSLLDQLGQGANSAILRFADALRRRTTAGRIDGVVATSTADLSAVLEGVFLDAATVQLDAGAAALDAADWMAELLTDESRCDLGVDPLAVMALTGDESMCVGEGLDRVVSLVSQHRERAHVRAMTVDTATYVEAGATEVQELAAMLATAAEYLRWTCEGDRAALGVHEFTDQTALCLVLTADQFSTIAKLRAARVLWAHLLDACGDPSAERDITGVTSRFMLTVQDPWVNLLRNTTATLAGVVGGAESVAVLPHDTAVGVPGALARRSARNTQLLLQDESRVGNPVDPAGGSPYVEQLTEEFVRLGWELFREIESRGGLFATLKSGWWQQQIADRRNERSTLIEARRQAVTGVSEFPLLGELSGTVSAGTETGFSDEDVAAILGGYLDHAASSEPRSEPLEPTRASAGWEALRASVEGGVMLPITLLCLGSDAQHGPRQQWAENLLGAAGFGTRYLAESGAVLEDLAGLAEGAAAVMLCGNDDAYAAFGGLGLARLASELTMPVLVAGAQSAFERPTAAEAEGLADGAEGLAAVVFVNARTNVFDQMSALAAAVGAGGLTKGESGG